MLVELWYNGRLSNESHLKLVKQEKNIDRELWGTISTVFHKAAWHFVIKVLFEFLFDGTHSGISFMRHNTNNQNDFPYKRSTKPLHFAFLTSINY